MARSTYWELDLTAVIGIGKDLRYRWQKSCSSPPLQLVIRWHGHTCYANGLFEVGSVYTTGTVVAHSSSGSAFRLSGVSSVGGTVRGAFYYVGGLGGFPDSGAVIDRVSSSTAVVGASAYIGGLFGASRAPITNAYSTGSVTGVGASNVGGFIGAMSVSPVQFCYALGPVLGTDGFGVTFSGATVTDSYWNIDTTGKGTSASGVGRTNTQMKDISTFTGWDFTNVWQIGALGYPELR